MNQTVMRHTSRHAERFVRYLSGVVTITACALFWAAPAHCSTPAEDFMDDKLLVEAAHEVAAMNRDQLESFIDYIAVCGAAAEAPNKGFQCEIATRKLQIKAGERKALMRLVLALSVTSHLVSVGWDTSAGAAREKLTGYLNRGIGIFRAFQTSAATRYVELTQRSPAQP